MDFKKILKEGVLESSDESALEQFDAPDRLKHIQRFSDILDDLVSRIKNELAENGEVLDFAPYKGVFDSYCDFPSDLPEDISTINVHISTTTQKGKVYLAVSANYSTVAADPYVVPRDEPPKISD